MKLGRLFRHPLAINDELWSRAASYAPCVQRLTRVDRVRLRTLAEQFLRTKAITGAAGLEPDATMHAAVAIKACVPILNLGLDFYSGWSSVVLYPGDFRVPDEYLDEIGVMHESTRELCGESLSQGPMVLSWEAIIDDRDATDGDLVIHECAHKLDILNGAADGFPPLHTDMAPTAWTAAFKLAYTNLCRDVEAGVDTALDPYGATDPAEFFAVLSETFFTAPELVRTQEPAIHDQLRAFYRLDPLPLAHNAP